MNLVVCIKRVPDTETRIRVGPDGRRIAEDGVNYILNPYDEIAVEEALRIKEKVGGEVTVLTLGGAGSDTTLRTALAMGADKGILIKETSPERDSLGVAQAIAAALKGVSFDLLIFGRLAIDDQAAHIGPAVATLLGIPCVIDVIKTEIADGKARLHRELEGRTEIYECPLPAAFTTQKGLNDPRYASLKGIMAAKKKPIEEKAPEAAAPGASVVRLELPPPRQAGKIVGKGADAVPELVRLLREEAKVI